MLIFMFVFCPLNPSFRQIDDSLLYSTDSDKEKTLGSIILGGGEGEWFWGPNFDR
jgi:hypothetical protein